MVSGIRKSRTYRRMKVRTPGGELKIHYELRLPKKPKCANCGHQLHAVPRRRPTEMQNMPKTKKRPERPYGGVLCSKCMRQKIIDSLE
ncbi:50S ribosomal protein L34e [Candidatus Woesearchaeota archaeon]|nr:50S ribosomal protein L34e [Candidatus Woesearchaeota archaeon]